METVMLLLDIVKRLILDTYMQLSHNHWWKTAKATRLPQLLKLNEQQFYLFDQIQTSQRGGQLLVQSYFPLSLKSHISNFGEMTTF